MRRLFLTPPNLPTDSVCKVIKVPNDKLWLGIFNAALLQTLYPWNWEQVNDTDLTIEEATATAQEIFYEYLESGDSCLPLAPYWDEESGDDADGDDLSSGFPWYENLADWAVTAFLAASFTPDAAIQYITTIRKVRLWFRTRDYGAIVRVLVDSVELGTVDTYSPEPGLIEFAYDIPEPVGFTALAEPTGIIRIEHTGTANSEAIPTDQGYAVEVIRKRLDWEDGTGEPCAFNARYNGDTDTIETSVDGGETWQEAEYLDPRTTYQQPPVDTSDPQCDAAARMTAEIKSLVDAGIENVDNLGTQATGMALLFAGLAGITGVGMLAVLVAEVVDAFLTVTTVALHDAFDEFDWDEMTCTFLCLINDDGRIDEFGLSQFVQNYINTLPPIPSVLINLNVLLLGWGGLSDYAALRSETGDCTECDCGFIFEELFLDPLQPETIPGGDGLHDANIGRPGVYFGGFGTDECDGVGRWITQVTSGGEKRVQVTIDFGRDVLLSTYRFEWHSGTSIHNGGVALWDNANFIVASTGYTIFGGGLGCNAIQNLTFSQVGRYLTFMLVTNTAAGTRLGIRRVYITGAAL